MKKTDYSKMHEHQMSDLFEKYEALQNEIKEMRKEHKEEIKVLNSIIINLQETIKRLIEENERLKNNNKKDSSNSSKPSSTNGSKIIPNNREKSNKPKGGQKGHKAHTLKSKRNKKIN